MPFSHLVPEDRDILIFLRAAKFSLERTKEKLDMFYTIKAMVPEWFENLDPKDPIMEDMLNRGCGWRKAD